MLGSLFNKVAGLQESRKQNRSKQKHALNKCYFFGIRILKTLNFRKPIENICRQEIFINKNSLVTMQCFINSLFNHAPIIWVFWNKTNYHKMQKIHWRSLNVVYNHEEPYDELLMIKNKVSAHQRYLRGLPMEVFSSLSLQPAGTDELFECAWPIYGVGTQSVNNITPDFMWSNFAFRYVATNIRNGPTLKLPKVNSIYMS